MGYLTSWDGKLSGASGPGLPRRSPSGPPPGLSGPRSNFPNQLTEGYMRALVTGWWLIMYSTPRDDELRFPSCI